MKLNLFKVIFHYQMISFNYPNYYYHSNFLIQYQLFIQLQVALIGYFPNLKLLLIFKILLLKFLMYFEVPHYLNHHLVIILMKTFHQ